MMDPQGYIATPGPIRRFSQRSVLYKVAFFAIILSFLLYMYTFFSSNWMYAVDNYGNGYSKGLWTSCDPFCNEKSKFQTAIQVMACVCVGSYLCTIVIGFVDNCQLVSPFYHSRKLDWTALFTGTVGIMVDITYVLMYYVRVERSTIRMDYIINFSAIFLLFVAVTIIAFSNRNPQSSRGRIISTQIPMTVQYNAGQPHDGSVPVGQATYLPWQNEPFLSPHPPYPPGNPPPYNYPPSYPGDNVKA